MLPACRAAFPGAIDPTDPAQLRRLAIYNNYRALVDTSGGGGYGSLYGPTVDAPAGSGPGRPDLRLGVSGATTGAVTARDVTMMVQIPEFFGQAGRPACIVTGPSSGSRGVYGAIGTSGEWGLKKGCAVAYTDKGTGIGAHDLQAGTVTTLQGVREPVADGGPGLQLHRQGARSAAGAVSRGPPQPLGLEARALARQPRGRLGRVRPATRSSSRSRR